MTTIEVLAAMLLVAVIAGLCYSYDALGRDMWARGESQSAAQDAVQRAGNEVARLGLPAVDVLAASPGSLTLQKKDGTQVSLVLTAGGDLERVEGTAHTVVATGLSAFEPQFDAVQRVLTVGIAAEEGPVPLSTVVRVQLRNHSG
jgi:hypothetical protein